MIEDFWRSARDTWQDLTPEIQFIVRGAGVFVAALVAAGVAGGMVRGRLRAAHFDDAFRRPWSPPTSGRTDAHLLTPTRLVTALVRLTVLAGGLWVIAYLSGWTELARDLERIAGRVWALAVAVLAALYLSRLLSEKVVEAVQASPLQKTFEGWQPPTGVRESRAGGPGPVVGLVTDVVAVLIALLVAADLTGLTLTGQAVAAAWELLLHVATAGVALLIGWLGARWVRAQTAPEAGPTSPTAGFGSSVAASVMGGAVLLAVLLLAGNFPTYFGLVVLALVVMLVWPAQRWLPDVYAGVLLRWHGVKEVQIDGGTHPVKGVGLLQSELSYPEGSQARRNRDVLEAHLSSPQAAPGPGPEAGSPESAGELEPKARPAVRVPGPEVGSPDGKHG
jgi:hypothetical protein